MRSQWQRVVRAAGDAELVLHEGELNLWGTCRHVELTCGHVIHGNPTMRWRVNELVPCGQCKKELTA